MTDVTQILSQIEQGDSGCVGPRCHSFDSELPTFAAAGLANEKPGPDTAGHRARSRGVPASYRRRVGHELGFSRPLLRVGCRSHAKDSRGQGQGETGTETGRWTASATRTRRCRDDPAGAHPRRPTPGSGHRLGPASAAGCRQGRTGQAAVLRRAHRWRQAPEALGIGVSTADKYWAYAKVWLRSEMQRIDGGSG